MTIKMISKVSGVNGEQVLHLVLSLSLSHTGHWKFFMAPHGKELSEDLKKNCCST